MTKEKAVEIFLHPAEESEADEETDRPNGDVKNNVNGGLAPPPPLLLGDTLRHAHSEPNLSARVCLDRPVLNVTDFYGTNRQGSIKFREEKPQSSPRVRIMRTITGKGRSDPEEGDRWNGARTADPPMRKVGFTKTTKRGHRLGPRLRKGVLSLFPCIEWFKEYKKEWIANDLLSGLTAAIFQVPQGLANALVTKVPTVMGLYTSFFPALIYSFLGTSRQSSIGTFTVIGLMAGTSVVKYSDPRYLKNSILSEMPTNGANPMTIAAALALIAGITQVALCCLRLGKLGILISPPLASGFSAGCAVQILVSQLKGMLGLKFDDPSGILSTPKTLLVIGEHIKETNHVAAALSGCGVVVLLVGKDLINPRVQKYTRIPLPWDLIVVICSVIVSSSLNLETKYQVDIVKHIPVGLPPPMLPPTSVLKNIIVDGMIIGIVGFVVTFSMAIGFAKKYNHKVEPNQELLAMGLGNMLGGVFTCTPSCGSLARSSVLESVGCKTQLTGMVCSVVMLFVLYVVGPYLEPLPKCVLATTLGAAMKNYLLSVRQIYDLWLISKPDSIVWALTFLAVAILDVTYGLVCGVIVALFTITWRMHSYRGVVLKEFQSTGIYVTHSRKRKMTLAPESGQTAVFRFASPLCFATAGHFERDFERLLNLMRIGRQKAVALDCSAMCFVDATGMTTLDETIAKCRENEIEIMFAAVPESVMADLDRSGTLRSVGYHNVFLSLQDATRAKKVENTNSGMENNNINNINNIKEVDDPMLVTYM